MYQKFVPENVKTLDGQYVDAVMQKDKTPFLHLQGEMSDEDFNKAFLKIFEGVPDGEIVQKSITGFNHSTNIGTEGKSKSIVSQFEIQKGDAYSLVTLTYALDAQKICCELVGLNVAGHETSPVAASRKIIRLALIIFGLLALISVGIGIFFIVRHRRKKSAAGTT